MALSDDVTDEFPCPKCGHQFSEPLARLKDDPTLTCPVCGERLHYDSAGTMRTAVDQIDEIDRLLDGFGKS